MLTLDELLPVKPSLANDAARCELFIQRRGLGGLPLALYLTSRTPGRFIFKQAWHEQINNGIIARQRWE